MTTPTSTAPPPPLRRGLPGHDGDCRCPGCRWHREHPSQWPPEPGDWLSSYLATVGEEPEP